jgi:hypothetical protein
MRLYGEENKKENQENQEKQKEIVFQKKCRLNSLGRHFF